MKRVNFHSIVSIHAYSYDSMAIYKQKSLPEKQGRTEKPWYHLRSRQSDRLIIAFIAAVTGQPVGFYSPSRSVSRRPVIAKP
jgi:hypothetical protein